MAPKRLGPGGRLRNSGFRPKSSLCGSDCICFYSTKGGCREERREAQEKQWGRKIMRRLSVSSEQCIQLGPWSGSSLHLLREHSKPQTM